MQVKLIADGEIGHDQIRGDRRGMCWRRCDRVGRMEG
jgi:hypothetical protein